MHRTIAALAATIIGTANAQTITPNVGHYVAAYNAIAMERAAATLLEAERILERRQAELAIQQEAADRQQARDARLMCAHAARIQRWAGELPACPEPGAGWHWVRK